MLFVKSRPFLRFDACMSYYSFLRILVGFDFKIVGYVCNCSLIPWLFKVLCTYRYDFWSAPVLAFK